MGIYPTQDVVFEPPNWEFHKWDLHRVSTLSQLVHNLARALWHDLVIGKSKNEHSMAQFKPEHRVPPQICRFLMFQLKYIVNK